MDAIAWDIRNTAIGGPFESLLTDVDILVNAIYLWNPIPPFITKELLERVGANRTLSVVVDISCDPSNPSNPLPIYNRITSISEPVSRIVDGENPLDVIAIDHLPTLVKFRSIRINYKVPLESSRYFSSSFIEHLKSFRPSHSMWNRCAKVFFEKTASIRQELEDAAKHIWLRDEAQVTLLNEPILTP